MQGSITAMYNFNVIAQIKNKLEVKKLQEILDSKMSFKGISTVRKAMLKELLDDITTLTQIQ